MGLRFQPILIVMAPRTNMRMNIPIASVSASFALRSLDVKTPMKKDNNVKSANLYGSFNLMKTRGINVQKNKIKYMSIFFAT
jgi:hypothetical protein